MGKLAVRTDFAAEAVDPARSSTRIRGEVKAVVMDVAMGGSLLEPWQFDPICTFRSQHGFFEANHPGCETGSGAARKAWGSIRVLLWDGTYGASRTLL